MKCLVILCLTLFIVSCEFQGGGASDKKNTSEYLGLKYTHSWQTPKGAITFMTFNVENLFDTKDDKGKDDSTYQPLVAKSSKAHKKKCAGLSNARWKEQCLSWDWSKDIVNYKLGVLAETIKQVKNGEGPDVLVLQEVENLNILKQLNDRGLHYPTVVLIEGTDKRGIDVAVMSRLKQHKSAKLHSIPFKGFPRQRVQDTRGILQVDLKLPDNEMLSVFGVHFPAPFHPKEMRIQAFKRLNQLAANLPKGRLSIAAGDFNVPQREDRDSYVTRLTDKYWVVGHKVACSGCPGSTYYEPKDSWSFLDMILWSRSFEVKASKWKVLKSSFRIVNKHKEQRHQTGAPKRFEISGPSGVSDHWPLAVDLSPVQSQKYGKLKSDQ